MPINSELLQEPDGSLQPRTTEYHRHIPPITAVASVKLTGPWNARCTLNTWCINMISFGAQRLIDFFRKKWWNYSWLVFNCAVFFDGTKMEIYGKCVCYRWVCLISHRLMWDIFLSNDSTRDECKRKIIDVLSSSCDVNNDVIYSYTRMGTSCMLQLFTCPRFILKISLCLQQEKGSIKDRIAAYVSVDNTQKAI